MLFPGLSSLFRVPKRPTGSKSLARGWPDIHTREKELITHLVIVAVAEGDCGMQVVDVVVGMGARSHLRCAQLLPECRDVCRFRGHFLGSWGVALYREWPQGLGQPGRRRPSFTGQRCYMNFGYQLRRGLGVSKSLFMYMGRSWYIKPSHLCQRERRRVRWKIKV